MQLDVLYFVELLGGLGGLSPKKKSNSKEKKLFAQLNSNICSVKVGSG